MMPATDMPARLAMLIAQAAADQGGTVAALTGPDRGAAIVRLRFAIVRAARAATGASWSAIGRALGGRSHATMIHAHQRADALAADDPAFRALAVRLTALAEEAMR